jgi:DNA gyrase subunit A
MKLGDNDSIASMIVLNPEDNPSILVVTERGFGKRSNASVYRSAGGRYVKGLRTLDQVKKDRNGLIVAALAVNEDDNIIILTSKGKMIRNRVSDLKEKGRVTMGIPVVSLDNGDTVQSVVVVNADTEEEITPEVE